MSIIELVKHEPNDALMAELEVLLAQAKTGEISGLAGAKLRPNNTFATIRIGAVGDLEMAGALAFAQHDLIARNKPL